MNLYVKDLTFSYNKQKPALQSISCLFQSGLTFILGPNGAGKITLMRILATLLRPTSGQVVVNGWELDKNPEKIRTQLGYLPQETGFFKHLTGYEFLDWIAVLKDIKDRSLRKKKIEQLIIETNLTEIVYNKIKTYSGGMKRRLGIAQALLGDPKVIIVDEPTAGLDPEEKIRFHNLLASLGNKRVIILSTHIVADVEECCDQVGILKNCFS